MKQFIALPEMYGDLQARRIRKFGRVELLRVFNDGAPYWFVRIAGFKEERERDRPRLSKCGSEFGNGFWRFVYLDDAESKFKELAMQRESLREEQIASASREKNKQRIRKLVSERKMHLFKKSAQKT